MSLKKSDAEYREKAADVARLERSWPVVCINMGSISACLSLYLEATRSSVSIYVRG